MANLDSILKSRDVTLPTKVHLVKVMVFPGLMYRCESWTIKKALLLKNWCFTIMVLEKTLESPLDNKEIKPDNPKGNHPWISIGRSDAETEALTTWWEELTHWMLRTPDAGKDWRQEKKGMTENETVGWHCWLDGHEFEQTLRVGDGEVWSAAVHRAAKSWTWPSNWTEKAFWGQMEIFK